MTCREPLVGLVGVQRGGMISRTVYVPGASKELIE